MNLENYLNPRMKYDFAIFIMVYGRPEKNKTFRMLKKNNFKGEVFLVADNTDEKLDGYIEKFGDKVLVFDKKKVAKTMDSGDNTMDLRSTLFSANTIFDLAEQKGYEYFFIFCDDYSDFNFKFNHKLQYKSRVVRNLDAMFHILLKYYKKINVKTIAFAQGGDFIGGTEAHIINKGCGMKRKAMNTFLCSTKRRFQFVGRLNEDCTTYVLLGSRGDLFYTIPNISVTQAPTLVTEGGLSDVYLDYGTYIKSFMSVMYNPSSIKVKMMGTKNKRIHHKINWINAVPMLLNQKHKKI